MRWHFLLVGVALALPPTPMGISNYSAINAALSAVACSVSKPLSASYQLLQASFGNNIVAPTPTVDLPIYLASPDPENCEPLGFTCPAGCVVLVKRGTCSFVQKAQYMLPNVTNATVMIVYDNVQSPSSLVMVGELERPTALPGVASFFMDFNGGDAIAHALQSNVSVNAQFNATGPIAPAEWTALRKIATNMTVASCDGSAPGYCVDCSPAACTWSDALPWTELLNLSSTLDPCLHRLGGTQCRGGHIVALAIPFPLMGLMPPAIAELPYLEYLLFESGGLTDVGCAVQNLTRLTYMDVRNHLLSSIPSCAFSPSLNTLALTGNMIATLPAAIASATGLKELRISSNNLQALPPEIGTLPQLTTLFVSNNMLSALPAQLGNLPRLATLSAINNGLTSVPSSLLSLPSLQSLSLDDNYLSALNFTTITGNLSLLSVDNNNLIAVPMLVMSMTSLEHLSLANNNISGPVPSFNGFDNLTLLHLNDNAFTGSVPTLNSSGLLTQLWLHNNHFEGPLPSSWRALVSVTELRAQHNYIRCPVFVMSSMEALTLVDLSFNNLSLPSLVEFAQPDAAGALVFGSLPSSVTYINMAYNNIGGYLDASWSGVLRSLQTLNVSHNHIQSSEGLLDSFTELVVFDLSYNNLTIVDSTRPVSTALRLIAYNGNPQLELLFPFLPTWLSSSPPEVLYPEQSLLCLSVVPVAGVALSNFQMLVDPAFSHSQFCQCIPGTYGKPPNCLPIPDYYEVQSSIDDSFFGIHRQVSGVDIVFGPSINATEIVRTNWIELSLGPDFTDFTDLLEVFVGPRTLKGTRLLTLRGNDVINDQLLSSAAVSAHQYFSLSRIPPRNVSGEMWASLKLEIYAPNAVVHFQSRKPAGQHVDVVFSHSASCPAGFEESSSVDNTCKHPISEFFISEGPQALLYVLVAVGSVCIVATMIVLTIRRKSRVVRAASFLFSMMSLFSLLVFVLGALLYAKAPRTEGVCHARIWLTFLPLVVLLTSFVTKVNRVRTIFTSTRLKTNTRNVKGTRLVQWVAGFAGLMTLWLIIFSAVPLTTLALTEHVNGASFDLVLECVSAGDAFFPVWCTATALYICGILVWGIFNAWQIRNIPSAFNESPLILACLVGVLILAGLCALFLLVLPYDPNLVVVAWGVGQSLMGCYVLCVLFGPKLWALRKEGGVHQATSPATATIGNSSQMTSSKFPGSFSSDGSDKETAPRTELEMVTERLDFAEKALKLQRQQYERIFREWGWNGELP